MKKIVFRLLTLSLITAHGAYASAGKDQKTLAEPADAAQLIMPKEVMKGHDSQRIMEWITQHPKYVNANVPDEVQGSIFLYKQKNEPLLLYLLKHHEKPQLIHFILEKKPIVTDKDIYGNTALYYAVTAPIPATTIFDLILLMIEQGATPQELLDEVLKKYKEYGTLMNMKRDPIDFLEAIIGLKETSKNIKQKTFADVPALFQPSNPHLLAIKHAIEDMKDDENDDITKGFSEKLDSALRDGGNWLELKDATGFTPFLYAAYLGKKKAMRFLIQAGADINAKTKDGVDALYFEPEEKKGEYQKLIAEERLKREKIREEQEKNRQKTLKKHIALLFAAIGHNNLNGIQNYVSQETINRVNEQGRTPLIFAAMLGRKEIVGLLLEAGANTAVSDNKGNSALHAAVIEGHYGVANLLITKMDKQTLQKKNENGFTAYDLAMQRVEPDKNKAEQLKLLVEAMLQGR